MRVYKNRDENLDLFSKLSEERERESWLRSELKYSFRLRVGLRRKDSPLMDFYAQGYCPTYPFVLRSEIHQGITILLDQTQE